MKLNVYSVYDAKAKAFITPFFLPNDAMAVRAFTGCARDPSHQFCVHAEDFQLYKLGTFSDELGTLEADAEHQLLALASSLKA